MLDYTEDHTLTGLRNFSPPPMRIDMRLQTLLEEWPEQRILDLIQNATQDDVARALAKEELTPADFAALLSPAALNRLEDMAVAAHRLTRRYFGWTIGMYAPIYISNICGCDCVYCGYAVRSGSRLKRLKLNAEEIRRECDALAQSGYQNVLLLTGEARKVTPSEYIAEAVSIAYNVFSAVSVEVYAMDEEEYRLLVDHGLDGVTLYMETYHRDTYARVHLKGQKRDYDYRLEALERAGRAGARRVGVGALLGLYDWRADGFWTAMHARYLQRACWRSAVSVSFPRLRHVPQRFAVPHVVTDQELVQLMVATRLFVPQAGFFISTRESAAFRDRLVRLGVTMMSAGSSTRPGGYATHGEETLEQFEIEDGRSPAEVAAMLREAGFEPVWKDFDRAFHGLAPTAGA